MRKLLFGAMVAALAGGEALAQGEPDVHAVNARAHAEALKRAWFHLEDLVRRRSTAAVLAPVSGSAQLRGWADADDAMNTAATATLGGVSTGWLADWTRRGVKARYCADGPGTAGTLLVWLDPARPMGVGTDHRSVRAAPRLYGRERRTLHWLDGGVAEGGDGRADVTLPACMTAGLPSGRAALAGAVVDPWVATVVRSEWERRDASCPANTYRPADLPASEPARVERRRVNRRFNLKGVEVAPDPPDGPWRESVNHCVGEVTQTVTETRSCSYTVEGQAVQGYEVWQVTRRVRGATTVPGTAVKTLSTCPDASLGTNTLAAIPAPQGTPETLPAPTVTFPTRVELTDPPPRCGDCFDGTVRRWRRHTDRHARFEWDSQPTVQQSVRVTNWVNDRSQCTPIPPTVLGTVTRSASAPASCPPGETGTASRSRNETYRREIPCGGTVREIFLSATAWVTDTSGCVSQQASGGGDDGDGGGGGEGDGGGGSDGDGDGDGDGEGGLGDGEDAAVGGDGLGSETEDPSDDGLGSQDGGDGDGGGGDC